MRCFWAALGTATLLAISAADLATAGGGKKGGGTTNKPPITPVITGLSWTGTSVSGALSACEDQDTLPTVGHVCRLTLRLLLANGTLVSEVTDPDLELSWFFTGLTPNTNYFLRAFAFDGELTTNSIQYYFTTCP